MERIYKKRGRKGKHYTPEDDKMTFRGYYFSLSDKAESPKSMFIKEIADLCQVSEMTVRSYIAGIYRPDAIKRKLIADKLGMSSEILFPNNDSNEVRDVHGS